MLACIYRRVSTARQDDSLENQEKKTIAYAPLKGLDVPDGLRFSDPDTSGRTPFLERDGGRALMNRLLHGDVKHLIIAKLDRLGRNLRDALSVIEYCSQHDITIHIVDLGGDTVTTSGHMGKLILSIFLAVAEWEVAEIRDRTTQAAHAKFTAGELTGTVPYGWNARYNFPDQHEHICAIALKADELAALEKVHGPVLGKFLIPHPVEQAAIRQLNAWRHTPDSNSGRNAVTSYGRVATIANNRGLVTKQGSLWTDGSVYSVLTNKHTRQLLQTTVAGDTIED